MSSTESEIPLPREQYDYVDIGALWNAAWQHKILIICASLAIGLVAVAVTLRMPDVYQSNALLVPVAQERARGMSSIAGLSALAGLAGVNLGAAAVDNTTLAVQMLGAREFLTRFVREHDLMIPLFAADRWDPSSRKWVINPEIYDQTSQKWVRVVDPPARPEPTDWEIFETFSKAVQVEQDPKTSLVRVSVESRSPDDAKKWLDLLIKSVNLRMRERDLNEANRSMAYLEQRLAQTTVSEIRMAMYQLIEEQMKTAMLAEARSEYVFRTLDPAVVPAEKSRPKRALICIAATLVGGFVVTCFTVMIHFMMRRRSKRFAGMVGSA